MHKGLRFAPKIALFLTGAAAGAIALSRRRGSGVDPEALYEIKKGLAELEHRLDAHEAAAVSRLAQIDSRLEKHASKLADLPSMSQLATDIEQLMSTPLARLDQRLATQAASIEVLKTTILETDRLLERVLESLDSLSTPNDLPKSQ